MNPLRQHVLVRLAIGAPLVLLAVAGLVVTIVNGRESRSFEQRAARLPAIVVDSRREEGAWRQHVTVQAAVAGHRWSGRAPVADPAAYETGQPVEVLYERGRALLEEERYDVASPALLWSALLVAGLLTGSMGWWWVLRCRRTIAGTEPAFAMEAVISRGPLRSRWWNLQRPWVTLFPLHGDDPVGSYPLMAGVAAPAPSAARLAAQVKGKVRDGGLVVARADGQLLWPRGRLRT